MDFGHLDNLSGVDFTLPPDHPKTAETLSKHKSAGKPAIYLGGPVWADAGYVGTLYPKGTKSSQYLHQYCQQFNAIELNATHYRLPPLETVHQWRAVASAGFKFSPKVPQSISHSKNFGQPNAELDYFIQVAHELRGHMGMAFLQMPPYFKPAGMQQLYRFLELVPDDLPLAVELRHADWFANAKILEEWTAMLESLHRTAIITDVAGRRDVMHMRLTSGTAFIRYNGYDLHPTDFTRLDAWVGRIDQWLKLGLQELYFYMHQPTKALSAELGAYFAEKINGLAGIDVKVPVLHNKNGMLF